jgi:pimeloyl-ACP methyl ester carboxylesterase
MNVHPKPRRRRGLLVAAAAIAALALVALPAQATSAATADARGAWSTVPTVVLVHGAFADPTAWDEVNASLRKDGYATAVPALGLQSVAADAQIVRDTLDAIPGPKVLVAHSYGGVVVSNAATGRSDVTALVLTTAYLPAQAESIGSLSQGYTPPAFLAPPFPPGHLLIDATGSAIIDPAFFRADFAQDLNPKAAARLAAAQRPVNLGVLFTPSGPPAWATIPSWYAISGADRIIDPALQRAMAVRAGSTIVTFDDASHAGGFTHYSARFTKLIEQVATSMAATS